MHEQVRKCQDCAAEGGAAETSFHYRPQAESTFPFPRRAPLPSFCKRLHLRVACVRGVGDGSSGKGPPTVRGAPGAPRWTAVITTVTLVFLCRPRKSQGQLSIDGTSENISPCSGDSETNDGFPDHVPSAAAGDSSLGEVLPAGQPTLSVRCG